MGRVDLYSGVHKGLRALFTRVVTGVARTDFREAAEAAAAIREVRELLGFLHDHARHEDEGILPELARIAPDLHAAFSTDHARVRIHEDDLERLLERLAGSGDRIEREALGRRVHERLWTLLAEHLRHMANEETCGNRALWAHLSDAELREIEGRIVAAIPPQRLAAWLDCMLPAMHGGERAELLAEMRSGGMPPEVFEQVTAGARAAMGPRAWETALAAASAGQEAVR